MASVTSFGDKLRHAFGKIDFELRETFGFRLRRTREGWPSETIVITLVVLLVRHIAPPAGYVSWLSKAISK